MDEIDIHLIEALRKERGILRCEFTRAIGQHPTNYSQWIKGTRHIPTKCYAPIAKFLNVKLQSLLKKNSFDTPQTLRFLNFSDIKKFSPCFQKLKNFHFCPSPDFYFPHMDGENYGIILDSALGEFYPKGTYLMISCSEKANNGQLVLARLSNQITSVFRYTIDPEHEMISFFDKGKNAGRIFNFKQSENFAFFIWPILWVTHAVSADDFNIENSPMLQCAEPPGEYHTHPLVKPKRKKKK